MDNKKIFIEAFSELNPLTDNEAIAKNVMERAKKMSTKKRFTIRKPFAVAAAAIITAAAATITVGAATDWDYFGVFGQIFGAKSENIKDNIVPEATVLQDTIDTMDFEIVAVAADKHSVMTILDVYSENDFKLIEETERGTIVHPIHDLHIYINSESIGSSAIGAHVLEQSEEKVRLAIRMTTENIIKDEKLTINVVRENRKEENGEYIIDSDSYYLWSAEFVVSYTGEEVRYEKEAKLPYSEVTGIEMSSISAFIEGENLDKLFEEYHDFEDNYLVLDSGEKVMLLQVSSSSYIEGDPRGSTLMTLGFAEPINPEEVVSITIGDNVIQLK